MQATKPTKARGFPKIALCRDCGCEFMKRSGAHVLCDSCAERSKEDARRRAAERQKVVYKSLIKANDDARKLMMQKKKTAPATTSDFWSGYEHDCKRHRTCVYGAHDGCGYAHKTGKLRSYDPETGERQHLIVKGKCDLYKRRQSKK